MPKSKANFSTDYKYLLSKLEVAPSRELQGSNLWVNWLRILALLFWVVVLNSVQAPFTHRIKWGEQIRSSSKAYLQQEIDLEQKAEWVREEIPVFLQKQEGSIQEQLVVPATNWQEIIVASGDNLSSIFQRQGVSAKELFAILDLPRAKQLLPKLIPGQKLHFLIDENGSLLQMKYPLSLTDILHIRRQGDSFKEELVSKELETWLKFAQAVIDDSLFLAGKRVGVPDKILMELVNIFGWDIDFARDVRAGDQFSLLYEEKWLNNEKVATGKLIMAEFLHRGKQLQAIRYTDDTGTTGYYTPEGYSMHKAFIRTPVEFTRISSRFSRERKHPILNIIRAHKGVDYAAPEGTPIKAVGNGKIEFIGTKGGYGKTIVVDHGRGYKTLYAHMSRFAKELRVGSSVKQGQVIGYVGNTGLATAPHLHFEFHINGVHHDPITVELPKANPIAKEHRAKYLAFARQILEKWETYKLKFPVLPQ